MADRARWDAFWARLYGEVASRDPYFLAHQQEHACVPRCVELGTADAWEVRAEVDALVHGLGQK